MSARTLTAISVSGLSTIGVVTQLTALDILRSLTRSRRQRSRRGEAGKVSHHQEAVTGLRSYRLIKYPLLAIQLKNVKGYPVLNVKVVFPNIIQRFSKFLVEFFGLFTRQ